MGMSWEGVAEEAMSSAQGPLSGGPGDSEPLWAQPEHILPTAALGRMPVSGQMSPSGLPLTCCSVCS